MLPYERFFWVHRNSRNTYCKSLDKSNDYASNWVTMLETSLWEKQGVRFSPDSVVSTTWLCVDCSSPWQTNRKILTCHSLLILRKWSICWPTGSQVETFQPLWQVHLVSRFQCKWCVSYSVTDLESQTWLLSTFSLLQSGYEPGSSSISAAAHSWWWGLREERYHQVGRSRRWLKPSHHANVSPHTGVEWERTKQLCCEPPRWPSSCLHNWPCLALGTQSP